MSNSVSGAAPAPPPPLSAANAGALAPWPSYGEDEIEAVRRVLASGRVNYWTGDEGRSFEAEYAAFLGVRHAVALSNGTIALEVALHALGIGAGDEVVVTSRSFVASAGCVALRGAIPIFADIDRDSQNLTAGTIEAVLSPRTKAIIVVHLAGWPCEMDEIMALARARGIRVIEDCAQAHGATYKGRPVGALADIAVFSFCQDKIITTGGEGGLLATDSDDWWRRAWEFKDHGKSYRKVHQVTHPPGFRWLHDGLGSNGRLTEMQAAIGRIQLRKLPAWRAARARNARLLCASLQGAAALRVPLPPAHSEHAFYRLYAYFDPRASGLRMNQGELVAAIEKEGGFPMSVGSCGEIYREAAFTGCGLGPARPHPVARECGETSLAFVLHPTLTDEDVQRMGSAVRKILARVAKS